MLVEQERELAALAISWRPSRFCKACPLLLDRLPVARFASPVARKVSSWPQGYLAVSAQEWLVQQAAQPCVALCEELPVKQCATPSQTSMHLVQIHLLARHLAIA